MADPSQRATALKVAKWLVTKGREDDAVAILAAWAAGGDNDAAGQELMAEALRVKPGAPIARLAFERMEGVPGEHGPLDEAIALWNWPAIENLQKQLPKTTFVRAQVGFNNNVKYKTLVFHIQTEDSGLDKPHVITHLFADGGRVIKSHKRLYTEQVHKPDVTQFVRTLMKGQQMEMAIMLREGRFDEIIAGRAIGGMETLTTAPRIEVKKLADREAATEGVNFERAKAVMTVQSEGARTAASHSSAPTPHAGASVQLEARAAAFAAGSVRAPAATFTSESDIVSTPPSRADIAGSPVAGSPVAGPPVPIASRAENVRPAAPNVAGSPVAGSPVPVAPRAENVRPAAPNVAGHANAFVPPSPPSGRRPDVAPPSMSEIVTSAGASNFSVSGSASSTAGVALGGARTAGMQSPALAAAAVQARIQARPHAQAARTEGAAYDPPFRLHVQRSLGGDPLAYDPIGDSTIIGAHGTVQLPRDKFCHPEEAEMRWRNGHLSLSDLPGGNGVFLRIQHLVELEPGDEFVVGDQLLRVELNPEIYDDGPTPEPTYFYSSPKPAQSAFRVTQVFEGGRAGSCVMARNNSVQIGAEHCELTLRGDVLVSPQHCLVEEQAGVLILTDLDSRTGVFVRIKGEQELMHGDEVLIGRTRLKLEFLKRAAK